MATGRVPTTANSPLTAKGDLFTYDTSQARLPVGSNGETLLADSSTSTGLRWQPSPTIAQPVLNGGMDIWQRGTSFSFTATDNKYTADRWFGRTYGNASTFSRQNTNDTTNLPFIQYCYRMSRDSGQTSTQPSFVGQSFETSAISPFNGKTVTVSFYARKGANLSGAFDFYAVTGTGTEANILTTGYTAATNIIAQGLISSITTTWQRYSFTGTIAAGSTQFAIYFRHEPSGTAGAADYAEFTGIQIDVGSTALPFRRTGGTIAGELALAQRYYYRQSWTSGGNVGISSGISSSTTTSLVVMAHPVFMRVAPSAVDWSVVAITNCTTYTTDATAVTIESASPGASRLQVNVTGQTTNQPVHLILKTNSFIGLSAEL